MYEKSFLLFFCYETISKNTNIVKAITVQNLLFPRRNTTTLWPTTENPERFFAETPQTPILLKLKRFFPSWKYTWSFFSFLDQKLRQVVESAYYVYGGAFRGKFLWNKIIFGELIKIFQKTPDFFPKNFVTFVKTAFSVSYGTFVRKKKILGKKSSCFKCFCGFWAKIHWSLRETFEQSCQNCVWGVRWNIFRLFVFSVFLTWRFSDSKRKF